MKSHPLILDSECQWLLALCITSCLKKLWARLAIGCAVYVVVVSEPKPEQHGDERTDGIK